MFKKIIVIVLFFCSSFIFVPAFESNASNIPTVSIQEPSVSDTQGYLILEFTHKNNGSIWTQVWFWSTVPYSGESWESTAYMNLTINSSSVVFQPTVLPYGSLVNTCISVYHDDQVYPMYQSHDGNIIQEYTYDTDQYQISLNYRVTGIYYSGNVNECTVNIPARNVANVVWGNESVVIDSINNVYASIVSLNSDMIRKADSILGELGYTHDALDRLKELNEYLVAEQQKSNTWLEKIFNYLSQSEERQKNQAQIQGNDSISQGTNTIDDKGGGFSDSLGGLVAPMSYSGTDCAWEFPTIKLPSIPGVMDEVVLVQKQPIDFAKWVNAIPSGILLVVQSLLTIGLIVYCFKELYDTISYVLTLRRSSNE